MSGYRYDVSGKCLRCNSTQYNHVCEASPEWKDGFDSALDCIIAELNNFDSKALFAVHNFINNFKQYIEIKMERQSY